MKYVVRRILYLFPTMVIVSLVIFFLIRILPGDVATMILIGPDGTGNASPEDIAALRAELGLDRPLFIQYADWLLGLMRLDAGNSLLSNEPVFAELGRRLPLTLQLGVISITLSLLLAVPLGVIAAVKRGTVADIFVRTFSIGGLAIPNFWIAVLVILLLVTYFNWVPPLGYVGITENPWKNTQQLFWPAMTLGYSGAALMSRLVRSSLLEVLREDYVRTARAKGLAERDVIIRHALRNSLLPLITVIGISIAGVISGTVIIETVFSLPGVGRYMVDAIRVRDFPVVQTLTFVFALIYAVANLTVDLLYSVIDPRIRLS